MQVAIVAEHQHRGFESVGVFEQEDVGFFDFGGIERVGVAFDSYQGAVGEFT